MKTEKGTKNKFSHFLINFAQNLRVRTIYGHTKFHSILHQISFNFAPNFIQFRTKFRSISNQISFNFALKINLVSGSDTLWFKNVFQLPLFTPHHNDSYLYLFCLFSAFLQVVRIRKGTKNKFSPITNIKTFFFRF